MAPSAQRLVVPVLTAGDLECPELSPPSAALLLWPRKHLTGKLAPLEELAQGRPVELEFRLHGTPSSSSSAAAAGAAGAGGTNRSTSREATPAKHSLGVPRTEVPHERAGAGWAGRQASITAPQQAPPATVSPPVPPPQRGPASNATPRKRRSSGSNRKPMPRSAGMPLQHLAKRVAAAGAAALRMPVGPAKATARMCATGARAAANCSVSLAGAAARRMTPAVVGALRVPGRCGHAMRRIPIRRIALAPVRATASKVHALGRALQTAATAATRVRVPVRRLAKPLRRIAVVPLRAVAVPVKGLAAACSALRSVHLPFRPGSSSNSNDSNGSRIGNVADGDVGDHLHHHAPEHQSVVTAAGGPPPLFLSSRSSAALAARPAAASRVTVAAAGRRPRFHRAAPLLPRLRRAACAAAMLPVRLAGAASKRALGPAGAAGRAAVVALAGSVKVVAAGMLCAFLPKWTSVLLGAGAILGGKGKVLGLLPAPPALPLPPAVRLALAPLAPLRGTLAAFGLMRLTMPVLLPGIWRTVMYWQRMVPIISRYMWVNHRAGRLRREGRHVQADDLWAAHHEWGADAIFDTMCDLKGFYLKLGQILAAKSDMLPAPYVASLSRLLDRLPPARFGAVRAAIERELGAPLDWLFADLDPFPLASATIAQVHRAVLPDGRAVAVKVQHGSARGMMRSDLANLARFSGLLSAARFDLGFDHASLINEYNAQVPLEFDFGREARVASSIRANLELHAVMYPILRRVLVPAMVPSHSSSRVLTMEYLDGVPVLDIAVMEQAVKQQLMTALVVAFGVMILRDGLFHSDPHPGNIMAMRAGGGGGVHAGDDLQVALLDFGQVKELDDISRARYALLVAALASRDDDLLRATMAELGLRVENCSDDFAATACYILFDTRMDFPEAFMSPMDPEAHEFRTTRVPALPQDLFMIMRVITLMRGVLASLQVNISSAQLWRPLALQTLADLTPLRPLLAQLPSPYRSSAAGTVAAAVAAAKARGAERAAAAVEADRRKQRARAASVDRTKRQAAASFEKEVSAARQRADREAEEDAAAKRLWEEEAQRAAAREAAAAFQRDGRAAVEAKKAAEREATVARRRNERAAAEAKKVAEREAVAARKRAERAAAEAKKAAEREAAVARQRDERAAAEAKQAAEHEAAARKREERAAAEAKKIADREAAAARKRNEQAAAEARKVAEHLAMTTRKQEEQAAAVAIKVAARAAPTALKAPATGTTAAAVEAGGGATQLPVAAPAMPQPRPVTLPTGVRGMAATPILFSSSLMRANNRVSIPTTGQQQQQQQQVAPVPVPVAQAAAVHAAGTKAFPADKLGGHHGTPYGVSYGDGSSGGTGLSSGGSITAPSTPRYAELATADPTLVVPRTPPIGSSPLSPSTVRPQPSGYSSSYHAGPDNGLAPLVPRSAIPAPGAADASLIGSALSVAPARIASPSASASRMGPAPPGPRRASSPPPRVPQQQRGNSLDKGMHSQPDSNSSSSTQQHLHQQQHTSSQSSPTRSSPPLWSPSPSASSPVVSSPPESSPQASSPPHTGPSSPPTSSSLPMSPLTAAQRRQQRHQQEPALPNELMVQSLEGGLGPRPDSGSEHREGLGWDVVGAAAAEVEDDPVIGELNMRLTKTAQELARSIEGMATGLFAAPIAAAATTEAAAAAPSATATLSSPTLVQSAAAAAAAPPPQQASWPYASRGSASFALPSYNSGISIAEIEPLDPAQEDASTHQPSSTTSAVAATSPASGSWQAPAERSGMSASLHTSAPANASRFAPKGAANRTPTASARPSADLGFGTVSPQRTSLQVDNATMYSGIVRHSGMSPVSGGSGGGTSPERPSATSGMAGGDLGAGGPVRQGEASSFGGTSPPRTSGGLLPPMHAMQPATTGGLPGGGAALPSRRNITPEEVRPSGASVTSSTAGSGEYSATHHPNRNTLKAGLKRIGKKMLGF